MPQRLTEQSRSKLDGIVQQMEANGEPEDAIHFVVSDFKQKYALPDRPVSPEDFTGPEQSATDYAWSATKALPGVVASGVKGAARLAYDATIDPILHPLRDPSQMPLRQDVKDIASSQLAQFGKAGQDIEQGRYSEAVGHTAAGVLPLAGPAAAQAGEKIGAGDPTGAAEAAALLLPSIAPRVGRVVAPKLASIGEQIAAKGGKAVKAAAPYAVPLAVDAALHYAGVGPVATIAKIIAKAAAKGERIAPEAAAAEVVPSMNAGGRVVPASAPTVEQAVSGALSDLQKPELPRRITTPPEPSLPPSYTPRTTVPKDVPKRMAKAAAPEPAAAPTPPKRAYFLRSPEEVAAIQARKAAAAAPEAIVPSDITDPSQMPEAWRSRMGPPEFPKPRKPASQVTKAQIDDLAKGLTDSGLSAREAIRRISKDSSMSAETRVRLMTALGKLAKAGAK